ncbi:MAG: TRAP transporter substrate-binding protein DctP [Deltaproteobacteria bacterium]|nr:TRAP transporter substrate-binding protein DctP [Deltaproteobacteria bacterium]
MKKILFISASIIFYIFISAGYSIAEKPEIVLTFTNWTSPTSPPGRATEKWIEMIETSTQNRVKVRPFYNATLLTGKNTIDGILRGVADVGMNASSFRPERFPMMALLNYPHPYKHTMVPVMIAWEMYNRFDPPEFRGVKVISFSCNGLGEKGGGFFGRFPVNSIDDVRGKEIRSTGTGVQALEKLSASPVFLPVSEIYEALQKNIIKGNFTTFEIIKPFRFNEVIDYITPFPAPAAVMFTIVNEERFNAWPDYLKNAINDMSMEHSEWAGGFAHRAGEDGLAFAVENGVKMTEISPAEKAKMMKVLSSMTNEWLEQVRARGLPAREWLDEFNRLLEKYNNYY